MRVLPRDRGRAIALSNATDRAGLRCTMETATAVRRNQRGSVGDSDRLLDGLRLPEHAKHEMGDVRA